MHLRILTAFILAALVANAAGAKEKMAGDELFTGPVPTLRIEIPPEGMRELRRYQQFIRQERPVRVDVRATVREGGQVYTDVAVHLKGSYTFQGIDAKPSLTLNFDKFNPGQKFHGMSKIHLNNSAQDPTALCEQFARDLFREAGVASPRATPALVHLNGNELGVCVLVEGANKGFVKRHFGTGKGNLYDGGSNSGDVNKELKLLSGEEPANWGDLEALADAAQEPDAAKRLERLEKVLDVENFITFAAIETLIVHWDGYAIGCNNYRVYWNPATQKIVFLPHGLDQLFGKSNSPEMSLTPMFKGLVARTLLGVPEARKRYFTRIEELSKGAFATEALIKRLDQLAERLNKVLDDQQRAELDYSVRSLKTRIEQRGASVARQLASPAKPLKFAEDGTAKLAGWTFRPDSAYMAQGGKTVVDGREVLRLSGGGGGTGGSWRTTVLLEAGQYEFTGMARTRGAIDVRRGVAGVMLRISGETSTDGLTVSDEWKSLSYPIEVSGEQEIVLVCEFRSSAGGMGEFDASTLRLVRKQAGAKAPKKRQGLLDIFTR
jgi:spore coat protein CotH